jgi:hypothetical protein
VRPILFVVAVAGSGSGKEHPRRCIKDAMIAAELQEQLGGETFASGSSVITAMATHPSRIFLMDEVGQHIKTMLDPLALHYHRREIMTQLTTFWSSGAGVVTGPEYANQKERPRIDICQPNLCLYGSTVPSTLWDGLQSGNMNDGSLARFLIFATPENYPDRQNPEPFQERLADIATDLKAVAKGAEGWEYGNLDFTAVAAATPYPVPLTDAAKEYDADLDRRQLALLRRHENTAYEAILARHREQVLRVALVAAVADCPGQPVLDARHLQWAEGVVTLSTGAVMEQAKRFLAASEHERQLKRLLEIIRKYNCRSPKRWIPGVALANIAREFPRKLRAELIDDLEEMGEIEVRREGGPGTGRKATWSVRRSTA